MTNKEAYKIVLEDMINSGCGLLVGEYDAVNGGNQFMYGINTVMEFIAYSIDDETGDSFSELFLENMQKSVDKAKQK